MLEYLPQRPERDYDTFKSTPNERTRPLPTVQWDSRITEAHKLENLKEIHFIDYLKVQNSEDSDDDDLVTVVLIFIEINFDVVPIVANDEI